jgi:ATP-binding protein involved in chromosome partitioning
MPLTEESVLEALRGLVDPRIQKDYVSLGAVQNVQVGEETVSLVLEFGKDLPVVDTEVRQLVQSCLTEKVGAKEVRIGITRRDPIKEGEAKPATPNLSGVKTIIGCGSGKGGVGKSTVSVNLALSLVAQGKKVGLMDADIYGPNLPGMLGIKGKPDLPIQNDKIIPVEVCGLKLMSMGFLIEEDNPVIWRGPMLNGVIKQFLFDVVWGELDVLLIDLPPGTGDVQLSLSQLVPMTGVVVVTTPQNVALQDVRKAIAMFQKTRVPVLGIVENMSHFICGGCGEKTAIFSEGGGKNEATRLNLPFLGEIPLKPSIREGADEGKPIVVSEPDSPEAKAFNGIALKLNEVISQSGATQQPSINF